MADRNDNLDPVEALWRELHDAEHAGVFRRTVLPGHQTLSPDASVSGPPAGLPAWVIQLRRRWVPIAACLALAVGVWSVLFSLELGRLRAERGQTVARSEDGVAADDRLFVRCLSGPGRAIDDRCRPYDLDTDGQITLADFRAHQLAVVPHTN